MRASGIESVSSLAGAAARERLVIGGAGPCAVAFAASMLCRSLLLAGLCALLPAQAHKPPTATGAESRRRGGGGNGTCAARLRLRAGPDANGDGESPGAIACAPCRDRAYALARLQLTADAAPCVLTADATGDDHTDGAYTVLEFAPIVRTAATPQALAVGYTLFSDIDPQHVPSAARVPGPDAHGGAGPAGGDAALSSSRPSSGWTSFWTMARGMQHIWVGYDHICSCSRCCCRRCCGGALQAGAGDSFRQAAIDVLRVVTVHRGALDHLSLATLGLVAPPSRLVESTIALSVLLAALNNVWRCFTADAGWWLSASA